MVIALFFNPYPLIINSFQVPASSPAVFLPFLQVFILWIFSTHYTGVYPIFSGLGQSFFKSLSGLCDDIKALNVKIFVK